MDTAAAAALSALSDALVDVAALREAVTSPAAAAVATGGPFDLPRTAPPAERWRRPSQDWAGQDGATRRRLALDSPLPPKPPEPPPVPVTMWLSHISMPPPPLPSPSSLHLPFGSAIFPLDSAAAVCQGAAVRQAGQPELVAKAFFAGLATTSSPRRTPPPLPHTDVTGSTDTQHGQQHGAGRQTPAAAPAMSSHQDDWQEVKAVDWPAAEVLSVRRLQQPSVAGSGGRAFGCGEEGELLAAAMAATEVAYEETMAKAAVVWPVGAGLLSGSGVDPEVDKLIAEASSWLASSEGVASRPGLAAAAAAAAAPLLEAEELGRLLGTGTDGLEAGRAESPPPPALSLRPTRARRPDVGVEAGKAFFQQLQRASSSLSPQKMHNQADTGEDAAGLCLGFVLDPRQHLPSSRSNRSMLIQPGLLALQMRPVRCWTSWTSCWCVPRTGWRTCLCSSGQWHHADATRADGRRPSCPS